MCKSGSCKTWRTCKAQWSSLGNQVKQHLAEGQSMLREVKSYLVISQCLSHCQPLFWVEMEEKEHPKSLTSRNLRCPHKPQGQMQLPWCPSFPDCSPVEAQEQCLLQATCSSRVFQDDQYRQCCPTLPRTTSSNTSLWNSRGKCFLYAFFLTGWMPWF